MISINEPSSPPSGSEPRRLASDLENLITTIATGTGDPHDRPGVVEKGGDWEDSIHGSRPSRDAIRTQIASEQAAVNAKLSVDEPVFVITASGSNRVHLPGCSHVQHVLNRAQAWEQVLGSGEVLTLNHLSLVSPPPRILTRREVERLNSYTTCQTCSPTLDHRKKLWVLNTKPMLATNFGLKHIGRDVTTPEGHWLGELIGHHRILTAEGIRSITTTTNGSFEGDGYEKYVIGPKPNL